MFWLLIKHVNCDMYKLVASHPSVPPAVCQSYFHKTACGHQKYSHILLISALSGLNCEIHSNLDDTHPLCFQFEDWSEVFFV